MGRFLMNTSEVSSIAGELTSINTSLSQLSSKVAAYQTTFEGNSSAFDSAKNALSANISTLSEKVNFTQQAINKCVETHTAIQGNTYSAFVESMTAALTDDLSESESSSDDSNYSSTGGSSSSGRGSYGGSSGNNNLEEPAPVSDEMNLFQFGLIDALSISFETLLCEDGQISQDVINSASGFILIPETLECIAPIGYAIGSYVSINSTDSSINNIKYKVVGNLPNCTSQNCSDKAIVATTTSEAGEAYKSKAGIISKVGVQV